MTTKPQFPFITLSHPPTDIIENNLPLQKQVQLLSDLCTVTSGKPVSLPLSLVHECTIGPDGSKLAFDFALVLYHRWILRSQLLKELPARAVKPGFGHMLTTQEQANSYRDEMFVKSLEPLTITSIKFLSKMVVFGKTNDQPFAMLTYDSFVALQSNSDRIGQNFDVTLPISRAEVQAQISYDLCTFYLHAKINVLAREFALDCRRFLDETKAEYAQKPTPTQLLFCTFDERELYGCMLACGVGDTNIGLLHRMNDSVLHKYSEIVEILRQDNLRNEIPLVNRRIIELDIEGSQRLLNLPKDLLVQVAALNVVKSILLDGGGGAGGMFSFNDFLHKYAAQNGVPVLLEQVAQMLPEIDVAGRAKLKEYFLDLLLTTDTVSATDADALTQMALFSGAELSDIERQRNDCGIELAPIGVQPEWQMNETKGTGWRVLDLVDE